MFRLARGARRMGAAAIAVFVVGTAIPILWLAEPAGAAAPVTVNTATTNWVESFAGEDDGNRSVSVTFVARHDAGRRITAIAADADFDGIDETGSLATTGVSAQYLGSPGTNRLASSVVRFSFTPPEPGGYSCPLFGGGTRRVDVPLRFRLVDDLGQRTGSTSYTWRVIEDEQCTGTDDFPTLESVGQSATNVNSGQSVAFNFVCDDADSTGTNDRCDFIQWRWRRLNDGVTSGLTTNDAEDNVGRSFNASFPTRGAYVVEAQLCGEDSCQDTTFWRIGSVLVNESTPPAGSISFTGAEVVPSSPPSVNPGDAATAVTNIITDGGGTNGAAQVIEWDAAGDGTFERTEFTTPSFSGGVTHPDVSGAQVQQSVNTATFGLKTVRSRLIDNGAIDASDVQRRTSAEIAGVLRVNAIPVASGVAASTPEDTPAAIDLLASDADNQPAALAYEIVTAPANGTVDLTGGTATYTPNLNYNGPDSFTFRAADGPAPAAWATSNTATVTLTVEPVNDAPVADDQQVATNEEEAVVITPTATDVEGDPLSFTLDTPPATGTVTGGPADFTYLPDQDFNGTDTFTILVDDGNGGTDIALITVVVNPVNDPATANDQSITTDEDAPFDGILSGTDIDGDPLAFAIEAQPVHGTVTGNFPDFTYTPDANYHGADVFLFSVDDGNGADVGQVTVTVNPVNDAPAADAQSVTTLEDTSLDVTLTGSDIDGDTLAFAITDGPDHGTLTGSGADLTYTPDLDYFGLDEFTFQVDDGNGGLASAVVSINVDSAPLLPTTLTVDPAVLRLQPGPTVFLQLTGTLTETASGAPVAGHTVVFSVEDNEVCAAVTDAAGRAACGGPVGALQAALNRGYDADYGGGPDHEPTSGTGALIEVVPGIKL